MWATVGPRCSAHLQAGQAGECRIAFNIDLSRATSDLQLREASLDAGELRVVGDGQTRRCLQLLGHVYEQRISDRRFKVSAECKHRSQESDAVRVAQYPTWKAFLMVTSTGLLEIVMPEAVAVSACRSIPWSMWPGLGCMAEQHEQKGMSYRKGIVQVGKRIVGEGQVVLYERQRVECALQASQLGVA